MLGASPGELAFVAFLLVIVLLAQVAPRLGEVIAARVYDGASGHDGASRDDPRPKPRPPASAKGAGPEAEPAREPPAPGDSA